MISPSVKELKWTNFACGSSARTIFNCVVYGVSPWYEKSGEWSVRLNGREFDRASNEEEAKSAMQRHYEAIILSALDSEFTRPMGDERKGE